MKTYQELIRIPSFEERFEYLRCNQNPSESTFGGHRVLNQILYQSPEWKEVRRKVIIRDNGCDLGITDRPIRTKILIHHINPISIEQVANHDPIIFDLNNLICCSHETHEAIHYGDGKRLIPSIPVERKPGDTTPWALN
ncbi:hypothetical protein [Lachnoclostridium sp. Marseille-P6806]|uniref:hypothetical protein n=1 Tax=Lachnoclostridium sp. Marseille-P6806 TaxID=2364793 RepID=UPI001030C4A2|nr:hypothetical protein [Lachnoclostridium sp. Marseille-P6806]